MLSNIWEYMRENREIGSLMIAATASLLTNVVSSFLETQFSLLNIILSLGIILLTLYIAFKRLYRVKREEILPKDERPARHAGLIVIVSPRKLEEERQVHEIAIEYHLNTKNKGELLRKCWLITTQGTRGTEAEAMKTQTRYEESCDVIIRKVNAFDISDVYQKANEIYQEAEADPECPLKPEQIIVDFTGGTTPMSSGLALACSQISPMQYIYGGRLSDVIAAPMLIDLRATR